MTKQKIVAFIAAAAGFAVATCANAEDLMQVYGQALHSDPTFKQAEANWWATKQNLPIAIAAYLPQIDATYNWSRIYGSLNPPSITSDGWHTQNGWGITATQQIFDFGAWESIKQASSQVKSATATYLSAVQSLMQRTSSAYFAVLQAQDQLIFTIANKRAVKRNLTTAEQQFKVGLIAITGVYDAQSRYDQSVANEIRDRNNVFNALENLRVITGEHYSALMGIRLQVPLVVPSPNNINTWVAIAEKQNYDIKAQVYTVQAAEQNIKIQEAPFFPTVSAQNAYSWDRNNHYGKQAAIANGANKLTVSDTWGLEVDWSMLAGGSDYYSTKQARYQYLSQIGQLQFVHRDVVNQARQSFLGIVSNISKIKADYLTIVSYKSTLKATEAGYQVGTRTMVDVLNSIADVYRSENTYMNDQYDYMNDIVNLKQAAGTLSVRDLQQLNSWLKKRYAFDLPAKYYPKDGISDGATHHQVGGYSTTPRAPIPPVNRASLSLNSGGYTVQLFAANQLSSAERFKEHNKLNKKLQVVKLNHKYKVIYGHYRSRSDALVALDALPIDHTKYHAWVEKLPTQAPVKHPLPSLVARRPVVKVPEVKPVAVHRSVEQPPEKHTVAQLPWPAKT